MTTVHQPEPEPLAPPQQIKCEDYDSETIEFLQRQTSADKPLQIYARPEIRKGCVWDIQLKFSPELIKLHNLRNIYVEKPRGGRAVPFLCLKVRSKLIKPIRELGLCKVATILNEDEFLGFNEYSAITLKVRFTARPRAVFHKHSDMMILLVAVKRGDQVLCQDEFELIFRGGTGSVHSADSRKALGREISMSIDSPPGGFPLQPNQLFMQQMQKQQQHLKPAIFMPTHNQFLMPPPTSGLIPPPPPTRPIQGVNTFNPHLMGGPQVVFSPKPEVTEKTSSITQPLIHKPVTWSSGLESDFRFEEFDAGLWSPDHFDAITNEVVFEGLDSNTRKRLREVCSSNHQTTFSVFVND